MFDFATFDVATFDDASFLASESVSVGNSGVGEKKKFPRVEELLSDFHTEPEEFAPLGDVVTRPNPLLARRDEIVAGAMADVEARLRYQRFLEEDDEEVLLLI